MLYSQYVHLIYLDNLSTIIYKTVTAEGFIFPPEGVGKYVKLPAPAYKAGLAGHVPVKIID
jgi:hypothetical protein